MGIKDTGTGDLASRPTTSHQKRKDAETAKRLKEFNDKARAQSLYEKHAKGQHEEEDDPSARAFDREKDIGGGLQVNATQRREMMRKAADFGSRFSSAKYL